MKSFNLTNEDVDLLMRTIVAPREKRQDKTSGGNPCGRWVNKVRDGLAPRQNNKISLGGGRWVILSKRDKEC